MQAEAPFLQALSSCEGRITKILVSFPTALDNYDQILERFRGLFIAMQTRPIEFVIVTCTDHPELSHFAKKHADFLRRELARVAEDVGCKPTLTVVPVFKGGRSNVELSAWVQDYFYVLQNQSLGITALLETIDFEPKPKSSLNTHIADAVAAAKGYLLKPVRPKIVGGDVLVNGTWAVVGNTIFSGSLEVKNSFERAQWREAEAFLKKSLGVEHIIWAFFDPSEHELERSGKQFENSFNSCFNSFLQHLDYFVTLGGPSAADERKQTIFVASVEERHCIDINWATTPGVRLLSEKLDLLAERFNNYRLGSLQFEVKRLPLIAARQISMVLYSFNNCLIEVDDGVRNAYLPVHLPHTSGKAKYIVIQAYKEARASFVSAGFNVIPVNGHFPGAIGRRGSLHCALKILERSNSVAASCPL